MKKRFNIHFQCISACVLTVQLNELVTSGQLQEYSIIRLDRYLRSDLKGQATKYYRKEIDYEK